MRINYKKLAALVLVGASLLTGLLGCKSDKDEFKWPQLKNADKRLLVADPADYADCPQHDVPLFEFYTPDTITLIRDGAVVGEYPKENATYEKILQMLSQALADKLQQLMDRHGEDMKNHAWPHGVGTVMGSPVETEDGLRTALLGRIYLVYTYKDNAYAPVYFAISESAEELSLVSAAQPKISGEFGGPFGFYATQELADYLKAL